MMGALLEGSDVRWSADRAQRVTTMPGLLLDGTGSLETALNGIRTGSISFTQQLRDNIAGRAHTRAVIGACVSGLYLQEGQQL